MTMSQEILSWKIDTSVDGHVHTRYCGHAIGDMEEYVLVALERGLKRLVFLEHFEIGVHYLESTWLSVSDFEEYWQEGLLLQEKYKGQIRVGVGVEVGYNPDYLLETKKFLQKYRWDRIGLSYHFFENEGQHINLLSRKKINQTAFTSLGVSEVLNHYLRGLLVAVKNIPCTVLCHLDAALRHHPEVRYDAGHLSVVDEIVAECVTRGIALEINTSGFPLRGEPFPSLAILKRAKAMGAHFVVGSDAHRPQDVGRYFDRLSQGNLQIRQVANQ